MDLGTIIPVLVAAGVLLFGIALAGDDNKESQKRLKSVAQSRESAVKRRVADPDETRRKRLLGSIKDIEMRERRDLLDHAIDAIERFRIDQHPK